MTKTIHVPQNQFCTFLGQIFNHGLLFWGCFWFLFVFILPGVGEIEKGSHSVPQAGIQLAVVLLPQSPECGDYRCEQIF